MQSTEYAVYAAMLHCTTTRGFFAVDPPSHAAGRLEKISEESEAARWAFRDGTRRLILMGSSNKGITTSNKGITTSS